MRNDALYIDGELVDLDDDTRIVLKLKSNVFTEVSKIVSNNSYTIKLPNTVHNQKVICHSDLPAYLAEYAYRRHKARYFRNGVEIIKDGQAILMSTGDRIEIVMVWGNFVNFSNIVNEGLSLKDLSGDEVIYFKEGNAIENYGHGKDIFYPYMNTRRYEKDDLENGDYGGRHSTLFFGITGPMHPVVRVPWILNRIAKDTGVVFDFSGKGKELIDELVIPLVDKKSNELTMTTNHTCKTLSRTDDGVLQYKVIVGHKTFEIKETGAYGNYFSVLEDSTVRFQFKGKIRFQETTAEGWNMFWINGARVVVEVDGQSTTIAKVPYENHGIGWHEVEFSGVASVSLTKGQKATLKFLEPPFIGSFNVLHNVTLMESDLICSVNIPDEVPYDSNYPIVSNLPDIKIVDFIKSLATLCGIFPKQENGVVKFISLDEIMANKSKAKNWTKRVVASGRDNKPKEMEYAVADYCQHNRFKWKEDDTVEGNYNGDLAVNNKTLDYEKDAITMPFSSGDGCSVPLYKCETDGLGLVTKMSYSACKPRIMREISALRMEYVNEQFVMTEKSCVTFSGLDFETILNERYVALKEVLNRARIIKENILVSEYDLKEFDESIPVYLGQYGKYYAVIEMKAEDNGIAEVQLLQL